MSSSSRSSPLEIFSFNPSSFFLVNHLFFFLLFSSPSLLQLSSSSSLQHPATGDNSLLQVHIPSSLRPPATSNNSHYPPCFHEHFRALLDLKRSFHFTRLSRSNLSSWNENNRDNCCSWEGVTCNAYNAHVIALNLIGLRLYRLPDFNSLFRLRSLQKLNLSRNFFHAPIPSGFHQLSSLTHLDLSINKFVGQVPLDFSGLTKLVALDLSWNSGLSFKKLGMKGLLQNLSSLTELNLDGVDLSTEGSQVLSYAPPALRKLSMSDSGLSGSILPPPSPLPLISHVDFSFNLLSSPFPRFIAYFTSLTDLDLHGCDLHGEFPKRIFNLPRIQTIDISFNQLLVGSFPEFSPNSSIQMLAMRNTGFYGMLPRSLGNLKSLTFLHLWNCNLSGPIPESVGELNQLVSLDLSENRLSGPIPQSFMNLTQLFYVDLSYNGLSGPIPSACFCLPSLSVLDMSYNLFSGELGWFKNASSSPLTMVHLNDNNLRGHVPSSLFELSGLNWLSLSMNNFSSIEFQNLFSSQLEDLDMHGNKFHGRIPKMIFQLNKLEYLDISLNNFSGAVDFGLFHNHQSLISLNLSYNSFTAIIDTRDKPMPTSFPQPSSLVNVPIGLAYLDLSFNQLKGLIPMPSPLCRFFSIANNQLSGDVSSQICNAKSLELMDLSNNNFIGQVPKCLGAMSHALSILKLGGNNLDGTFLQEFNDSCSLKTINLNKNRVEGKLPDSLANCKMLEVLDLGNNQINDTFPVWLKDLPRLRVLVLRSNQFHGTLGYHPKAGDFSRLQIFDIAFNNFTGCLATDIFNEWKAMVVTNKSEPLYLGNKTASGIYYEDTVTVMDKGNEMRLKRILRAFTLLDLSNNKFEGSIPVSVGNLKSLHAINMSHNAFPGVIPSSMGDIQELESLDLSYNGLSRKIPWQLEKIRWLAVLNLSQNCLEGPIPQGNQFKTFTNESFQGNLGFCGPPLSNMCGDIPPSPAKAKNENEYDWEVMWIAFGIGHGLGFGILFWTLALWRHGRIVFFTFTDRMLSFLFPPAFFLSCRCSRPRNPTKNGKARLKD